MNAGRTMPAVRDQPHVQIGEVARRTGTTQRTLRFYEEQGLLTPPTRMDGGFRLYSEVDIQRVRHIRELQQLLGFSLAEIKEMLEAEDVNPWLRARCRPRAALVQKRAQLLHAIEAAERQSAVIREKVVALTEMQWNLRDRLTVFRSRLDDLDDSLKAAQAGTPGTLFGMESQEARRPKRPSRLVPRKASGGLTEIALAHPFGQT